MPGWCAPYVCNVCYCTQVLLTLWKLQIQRATYSLHMITQLKKVFLCHTATLDNQLLISLYYFICMAHAVHMHSIYLPIKYSNYLTACFLLANYYMRNLFVVIWYSNVIVRYYCLVELCSSLFCNLVCSTVKARTITL